MQPSDASTAVIRSATPSDVPVLGRLGALLAMRRMGITPVYSAHARYFELRDLYSTAREVVGYPAYLLGART